MDLPAILSKLKDKISPDSPVVQKKITDTAEGLDADDLAAFVQEQFGVNSNNNKQQIERPEQESKTEPEIDVPVNRAAGGRVLASNINHSPTEAQKRSGTYAKDHVNIFGLNITIENAKNSIRRGIGPQGPWESKLPAHYGYIKGSEGADGDHLDVYLGPHIKSQKVYVVNQIDLHTGQFDEHKVMLCFGSLTQAIQAYCKAFSDGKGVQRIGSIVSTDIKGFKDWLKSKDTTKPHELPKNLH
jgi:hypothetical protein